MKLIRGHLIQRATHNLRRTISRLSLSKQIDKRLFVLNFGSGTGNIAKYLKQARLRT